MRNAYFALLMILLTGCATTHVVEVERGDDAAISAINEDAARYRATVQLRSGQALLEARKSLVIAADTVTYVLRHSDFEAVTPLADVAEIRLGTPTWGRAALVGGLVGGVAVGVAALTGCRDWCKDSDAVVFATGFALGGVGGALLGGVVGVMAGSPRTIYRFRPGTPREMKVVLSISRATPSRR